MLFDKDTDEIDNIFVIEIFKPGGATPRTSNATAHEFFHVLTWRGRRPLRRQYAADQEG